MNRLMTFVADTPPGRNVDFSISTDSFNNSPITDASITLTSSIQDHINRYNQNLIANPTKTPTDNPQNQSILETINPRDQWYPVDIQTDNTQDHLNQLDIQTNNLQDPINLHDI